MFAEEKSWSTNSCFRAYRISALIFLNCDYSQNSIIICYSQKEGVLILLSTLSATQQSLELEFTEILIESVFLDNFFHSVK